MQIEIHVPGKPVPQGSMTAVRAGNYVTMRHQQGGALAVWRAAIRLQCGDITPTRNPVYLALNFRLKRPRSHLGLSRGKVYVKPQYLYALPSSTPDLDKLVRAVMDSLTGVLYFDDSLVYMIVARKVYNAIEGLDAKASDAVGLESHPSDSDSSGQGDMQTLWETGRTDG
jgi:Holliday junction resolvase RusA-like endonuclease